MTMDDISDAELDAAIEGLDMWGRSPGGPGGLSPAMLAFGGPQGIPEDLQAQIGAAMESEREKIRKEMRDRRELAIMIQSKFIQIKHDRRVRDLVEGGRKADPPLPEAGP